MHVPSINNPEGVGVYCYALNRTPLALIGRYSGQTCGGLDTLRRNFALAHDMCDYLHGEGYHVLSEGFITEKQTWWLEQLGGSFEAQVYVLGLRVTLEEAVTGVAVRRAKRIGDFKEGSREYCDYQIRSCERTMKKLELCDKLKAEWVTRQTIEPRLLELLGISR